jgi:hypothetical protein
MIENLPLLTPDASRAAATMARCHDTLAARRRRIEARTGPNPKIVATERLFVAGLCLAYLVSMAGNVLRIVAAP